MRILVLSNVSRSLDAIVNGLGNSHSVIAKETGVQNAELADMVAGELGKGYDVCVVIARDPIGVSILLNKSDGISAVVCNSASDVALGKANNANVFVIRDPKSGSIAEIVEAISKLGYSKNFFKIALPKFQVGLSKKTAEPQPYAETQKKPQKSKQIATQQADVGEDEESEDNQAARSGGNGGIFGKLKDALGIV
ncbi:MAG: RpiB/LacA/LacB family sugar-phosphate isomerase [Candidatus Micrarchaeia archaeon]